MFERKYKFDATNERYARKLFTDDVLKEIFGSNDVSITSVVFNVHRFEIFVIF